MAQPVRQQIIALIIARVKALPWCGKVIEAGLRDEEVDGTGDFLNDVTKVLKSGLAAVELVTYDSVPNPEQSAIDMDGFTMDTVLIMHLPTVIPNDENDDPQLPSVYAAALCADVYKLHQPDPANPDRTFNGLALRADPGPGGGVGITDIGTVGTAIAFNTIYRHTRGDPETPR